MQKEWPDFDRELAMKKAGVPTFEEALKSRQEARHVIVTVFDGLRERLLADDEQSAVKSTFRTLRRRLGVPA